MKLPLMTWDRSIPQIAAAERARGHELLMDGDAFAAFHQRTARPLWAYLARVSGNLALADDLVQESYLRFLGSHSLPEGEVACRSYLFQIATNALRDHWRRRTTEPLDSIPEPATEEGESCLSERLDAEAVTAAGFEHMRPRERQLLWLAYAEGYTHREIAAITGLTFASVKILLFRARRKFAHQVEKRKGIKA